MSRFLIFFSLRYFVLLSIFFKGYNSTFNDDDDIGMPREEYHSWYNPNTYYLELLNSIPVYNNNNEQEHNRINETDTINKQDLPLDLELWTSITNTNLKYILNEGIEKQRFRLPLLKENNQYLHQYIY